MRVEDFGARYTDIPFATFARNHKKHTCSANIETLSHLHREMEMVLILNGSAKLHVDGTTATVTAGDLVIIPPYTLHRYTIAAEEDCQHYCVCFDVNLLYDKELAAALENGTITLPRILRDNMCADCVRAAFLANEAKKVGWALYIAGQLSLLFARLWETDRLTTQPSRTASSMHNEMFAYIAAHYTETITSSQAAAALHLNPAYFCRLFRYSFGERFSLYLCKYRLEKSKLLLQNTTLSISDVAMAVGFNSFSYYSKRFREYTGMTPLEYRTTKKA